jgi:hypothetical protein
LSARLAVCLIVLAACGCDRVPEATQGAPAQASPSAPSFISVSGTRFIAADGQPFEWRGITSFRLTEMIASGLERDVIEYLDWAASQQLTVVRVLVMAQHLFKLDPDRGRAALPRLLQLAKARGLHVEAVALADSRGLTMDIGAHVREVGRIAAEHGNAFVEIANEPGHPTQDRRLHDPAFVAKLGALIPERVVVAFGSVEYGDGFGAGDYVTFHSSRGTREWDHVTAQAEGSRLIARFKKPVVSDEPIGAATVFQQGRRDNEPSRFAAAAALTRLAGAGATFHYEGGLLSRKPVGREAECLQAWARGLRFVDAGRAAAGEFREDVSAVIQVEGARRTYARVSPGAAHVLVLDPSPSLVVRWIEPWIEQRRTVLPGILLLSATR